MTANETTIENTPEVESDTPEIREAQKYRKRAQEAEAERDTLRTQVESLQRSILDAAIEKEGLKPAAVWATGATIADMLTDDGTPDADKITAMIATARDTLGIPARPILRAASDGIGGNRGDDIEAEDDKATWQSALKTK